MITEKNNASDELQIRQLIDGFVEAFRTRNVDLMMSLYAPGFVAFDIVPPLQNVGKDMYKKTWEKAFTFFQDPIEFETRDLSITAGSDVAFSHEFLRLQATMVTGQKVDRWERLTFCFQKIDGKWLIAHEHVSVPADLSTGKAALDLKPDQRDQYRQNAWLSPEKTVTNEENRMENEAAIRELIDRFAKAFRAKDVNGVMSVFAQEIVSFDILLPLQAVGAETFVKHWQEFFESYQTPILVEFPDVSITASDDVAFSYCLHRIAGTLKSGHKTDFWLRWTACYRKMNGKWLIVHEHVSVPADLLTGNAALDLKP